MKKLLIIDNYDSFTYNLVHAFEKLGHEVEVWRNDEFDISEVDAFHKIVLSPGPGIPSEAGLLLDVIKTYGHSKSILGVCLGHQAIAEAFGGKLINLSRVYHGESGEVTIVSPDENLYRGITKEFSAGRYHSWSVDREIPDVLEVTSVDSNGEIMSLKHKFFDIRGIQFHPESILTPQGIQLLQNWIES